jgi:hypothetical protein
MKYLGKLMVLTLGLGLFAVVLSSLPSHPAAAAVGGPGVTVLNTSLSVHNLDDRGRIPYQSVANMTGQCPQTQPGAGCNFNFAAVQTGHRLVVQHVSGSLQFANSPVFVQVSVFLPSGQPGSVFFAPFNGTAGGGGLGPVNNVFSEFDQQILAYYDPGQAPQVQVQSSQAVFSGGASSQLVFLSGYVLDCSVAPCEPIAQ